MSFFSIVILGKLPSCLSFLTWNWQQFFDSPCWHLVHAWCMLRIKEDTTETPQFTMNLCCNNPVVNWKYHKIENACSPPNIHCRETVVSACEGEVHCCWCCPGWQDSILWHIASPGKIQVLNQSTICTIIKLKSHFKPLEVRDHLCILWCLTYHIIDAQTSEGLSFPQNIILHKMEWLLLRSSCGTSLKT